MADLGQAACSSTSLCPSSFCGAPAHTDASESDCISDVHLDDTLNTTNEPLSVRSRIPSPITDLTDQCNITVMQTSNDIGQRKWDKKYFCFYCDEPQAKLPRHLRSLHKQETEVVQIVSETNNLARNKLLLKIRNAGNHRHNCQVLRQGHGVLIVAYRPNHRVAADAYGPCMYCCGYYVRTDLWRHRCLLNPALSAHDNGKGVRVQGRVAHKSDLLKPPPPGVSFELNQILCPMKKDEVALIAKTDSLIIEFAKREFLKMGHDVDQHGYIRNKLRELGRLVLQLRKNTRQPNASLELFVHPRHVNNIINAVHDIAGFDKRKQLYSVPSLALKIGHSIKKCGLVVKGNALEHGLKQKADDADVFLELCNLKWRDNVSVHAHRTLYQEKRNKNTVLPTNADVVKMSSFLHETANQQVQIMEDACGDGIKRAWKCLNEVTLCHLIMFNRRRQGEVSKMQMNDFHKRTTAQLDGGCVLSDLERHLCKMFTVVEIVGKKGRTVPVLLSNEAVTWLGALVAKRTEAGVATENTYLFARCYGGLGHIRGSDQLRSYADMVGLENPTSIRSTNLRKHVATASQILSLKEHQLETLANFMGHDLRIHREYYQLPDTVQRVTQLSRLFLSLERGNLPSQKGRSLDELDVLGGGFTSDSSDDTHGSDDGSDSRSDGNIGDGSHTHGDVNIVEVSDTRADGNIVEVSDTRADGNVGDGRDTGTIEDPASKASVTVRHQRRRVTRRRWTEEERRDVMESLHRFFVVKQIPGKRDIERSCTTALQSRSWRNIKDFCRNQLIREQR